MISKIWEKIDEATGRLKVPGGWIVRSYIISKNVSGGAACSIHQVFVKDIYHEWKLEEG